MPPRLNIPVRIVEVRDMYVKEVFAVTYCRREGWYIAWLSVGTIMHSRVNYIESYRGECKKGLGK